MTVFMKEQLCYNCVKFLAQRVCISLAMTEEMRMETTSNTITNILLCYPLNTRLNLQH